MLSRKFRFGKYIPRIFTISDLVVVNILFALSLLVNPHICMMPRIRTVWVLVTMACLPMLYWLDRRPHYHRACTMDVLIRDSFTLVVTHGLVFVSLIAFLNIPLPLVEYVTFYALMAFGVPLWWVLSRGLVKILRRHGYNFVRVAIVGSGPVAERLIQELGTDAGFGYKLVGVFSDNPYPEFKGKVVGCVDDLSEKVVELGIDQIFYTISGTDGHKISKVLKIADDNMVQFYYVPQIPRQVARSFELHNVGAMPVLSMRRNPMKSLLNRMVKRAFDIVFSTVALVLSPLVFIPVAIGIKLSSKGPVFFRQERTGYKGRTFKCWKFRTMHVNNDADTLQATASDPRTFAFGKFLRHTSIDELPQFINVFLGDMSVVGPRPHMLKHTEEYSQLIAPYMVRHVVRPGITGWAQVNGFRGVTDELWKMERRVEHDVWYIENWTFLLDLKIIARTVINAMCGEDNAF